MSKIVTMMHRRPPPNATPFLLLVIAAVAVVITPTPAKSFAFQSSSSPVRLPFRLVATSTRPWSSSAASASSPSSQKHHPSGRVALAMSSGAAATDSMDASNNTGGTASIPNEVFNLVKSIVGAGVLSLPAGEFCIESKDH